MRGAHPASLSFRRKEPGATITVTVEQKQDGPKGVTTRQMKVSAPSIERALQISGAGRPDTEVRVVFPIDAEAFFAPVSNEGIDYTSMTPAEIQGAAEVGLPGAHDAWMELLKDDLGDEASEVYAHKHALA